LDIWNQHKVPDFLNIHVDPFEENKISPYLESFSLFWAPKTHFRIGRDENKGKHVYCLLLWILIYFVHPHSVVRY
jgi:hypothetical protein